jgi:hypothetical protein
MLVRPARIAALAIGATFHVVTFFNLEIGPFGLYALCLYLPLLPWENWSLKRTEDRSLSKTQEFSLCVFE